jgi:hypothetical protein
MNKKRKYSVSGIDDIGDVHTFSTDARERAEEMEGLMAEDLENVELVERGSGSG